MAWYASTACVELWSLLSPRRKVLTYRIAKLRDRHLDWLREDLLHLLELRREDKIRPLVAERLPLTEIRRAHELLQRSAAAGKLVLVP
jgi:NADPH2:quinone reductase